MSVSLSFEETGICKTANLVVVGVPKVNSSMHVVLGLQEEEQRSHENLRFLTKCSFLEIYNEQITDLLEPSSTNLQVMMFASFPYKRKHAGRSISMMQMMQTIL
jgi:hypothetical protein